MDTPLDNSDMEIFTDGSSFVWDGKHKAGYAMVTAEKVLEAKYLPQGTSAQLVELVALTRALLLLSLQSCLTLCDPIDGSTPGSLPWDSLGESTRVGCHCLLCLTAIYCPKEVAILHCKGHSRDGSKAAEGNQLADCQARKAGTL